MFINLKLQPLPLGSVVELIDACRLLNGSAGFVLIIVLVVI